MKLLKNRESGLVMILVLILLALGPLLVVPMLRLSYSTQRYNQMIDTITIHTYAADSGIEYAKYKIYNNTTEILGSPLQENLVIGGVDVYVTIEYNPDTAVYDITSTTAAADLSLSISSGIVVDIGIFDYIAASNDNLRFLGGQEFNSWESGGANIYCNQRIEIMGNTYIDGDVWAGDDIYIRTDSYISGDIWAGVDIDIGDSYVDGDAWYYDDIAGGQYVNGDIHPNADPPIAFTLPPIAEDSIIAHTQEYGVYSPSLYIRGGTHQLGTTYIDGYLDVRGDAVLELSGVVYVDGYVDIRGTEITGTGTIVARNKLYFRNLSFNPDNPLILPLMMMTGEGVLTVETSSGSAIFYAPESTDLHFVGSYITGSVAVKETSGSNQGLIRTGTLYYPETLRGRADLPGAVLETITYTYTVN